MTEAKDIQLSKGMLKLLKRIDREGSINLEDVKENEELNSLHHYSLIYTSRTGKYADITEKGRQVLLHYENAARARRSERRHNWLIAIFSTVGGALLSKPIWTVLEWIAEFF